MPFTIVRQDITKMAVDAVVNAANTALQMGGGVCGAIFSAAGAQKLRNECNKKAPINTGGAAITSGYVLPAKYIIHAVGPVYNPAEPERCAELLRAAYLNSLQLAAAHRCKSIAFPLISSGIYGYPKPEALKIAVAAIKEFLQERELDVYLAVFDKAAFEVSERLMGSVRAYIDSHYVGRHEDMVYRCTAAPKAVLPTMLSQRSAAGCNAEAVSESSIDDLVKNLDEPFNMTLLRLIDRKGRTDAEVYRKANIDRKLFSKIRKGNGYMPSKRTVLALAVALELSLEETEKLLQCAGYALSHSSKFDVIVEYFIISRSYDIYEINEVLFRYDQPLLGAG